MDNNLLPDLINAEFSLVWDGKEYKVRKATIRQVIAYQRKVAELRTDPDSDLKLVPFCLREILGAQIGDVTDDQILDGIRGDIISGRDEILVFLGILGFMTPEKVEMGKRLQEEARNRLLGVKSSPSSQTEPDGLPTK